MTRYSFAVDDVEIIEERERSQFATLKIDAFASDKNRHNMFVSEETLKKTAKSILMKPLVFVYDSRLGDFGSHDPLEVPCGLIPQDSEIEFKRLADGRLCLTVMAKIWKRYSGKAMEIFRSRSKATTPVSVEMEVYETEERPDGLLELKDFAYQAITLLGELVTPAIPLAQATVMQFAEEYKKDFETEFAKKYDDLDFTIPEAVKESAKRGLEFRKKYGRGGTSVGLATARYLIKNTTATPEKVRHIAKYFPRHAGDNLDDKTSNGWGAWLLWGGNAGRRWSESLVEKMNKRDEQKMSYFAEDDMPYKSMDEVNPAIKGIEPSVSLAQANQIAKQAESIGSDGEKNGWAIAISSFKKTHKVEDGRWVKKTEMAEEEKGMEEEKELEREEERETPAEEKAETPEKQEEEKEKDVEKKFSLDAYLDVAAALAFLEAETESNEEMVESAKEELKKGAEFANPGMVACAMYKMAAKYSAMGRSFSEEKSQMMAKMSELEEKMSTYMAENEELKKFKADMEQRQFQFEIEKTLKEVENAVDMPKSEFESLREKSKEFSLETIEGYRNLVKATAFNFAAKIKNQDVKIGLPFGNTEKPTKKSLWD